MKSKNFGLEKVFDKRENSIHMKLKLIFLTLLLTVAQLAVAQVKFEAKVSKKKLGVNERLRVDFEMNKDGDNFTPPSFTGFTVVGGPNQSISNSWINGKRSYAKTFSYFCSLLLEVDLLLNKLP